MADLTVDALGELTSPAANDEIGIWDVSAGQYLKIQRSTLVGATITGGGTIALGGYTFTVPATGTGALLATANTFTATQSIKATLSLVASNSTNNWAIYCYTDDTLRLNYNGSGTDEMTIESDGDVVISRLSGSGNRAVYSDGNGTLTNSSSDTTMKTDVVAIDSGEALTLIDALRPVRYNWIEELRESLGAQREIGLIAQEVAPHVPEIVGTNANGTLSLDYAKLVAVLIGAVQELSARVAALEAAE